jgi:hypothetical protein
MKEEELGKKYTGYRNKVPIKIIQTLAAVVFSCGAP